MHPLLFEIQLGPQRFPLSPGLFAVALGFGLLCFVARRRGQRDPTLLAALVALLAAVAAVAFGGRLLSLGAFRVPAFGALLALAVLLGSLATLRLAERSGLARAVVLDVLVVALFAGLFGARLGFVLLHPSAFASLGEALSFRAGGLSGVAGVVTGLCAAFVAARVRGVPAWPLLDASAPGFALGVVLTRLGCFLAGCDFGQTLGASAPRWLSRLGTFPLQSPAWVEHVTRGALAPGALTSLPVHPSELYDCAAGLALLGIALWLRPRTLSAGRVALAVFAGFFVLRALIDVSRPPSPELWVGRAAALGALAFSARYWWPRVRARHP